MEDVLEEGTPRWPLTTISTHSVDGCSVDRLTIKVSSLSDRDYLDPVDFARLYIYVSQENVT